MSSEIKLPMFEYTPVKSLPNSVAKGADCLGKVLTEEARIVGTAPIVLIDSQRFVLTTLHSFREPFNGRKIVLLKEEEIEVTEQLIKDTQLTGLGILAIPYSGSTYPYLEADPRGRFNIGVQTAHLGFPDRYLRTRNMLGPVASVGVVRTPPWDNPRKLVTTASMEVGQSGAPVLDMQHGKVGGVVVGGERLKALPGHRGEKRYLTLAIPISKISAALGHP